ncbi:MAG: hypothetical protein US39_C0012G0020 [Microgenomates group bacterium GW2011_GWC1_37_12b]|uniref:Uncharacterized protein n=1 Tax=Candidatus Woesebacteria bacterium GW2011_GWB1_38_8b TaxID=1618571 RepID=A0A0G0NKG0_9BACT|nr:MAG: hypothetical protein US39_C0012G0020 [Microgenomates group bacterium GW2011_GWC1_37_12b]KKQ86394.1 MAG: hypothetical protein UT10_C0026G0018 [Candidatus Woesebacteria bacterium GW2011_GWB1_38_8b]
MLSIVHAQVNGGDISNGFDFGQSWFSVANSFSTFDRIISIIIAVITVVAGLWFIFTLIIGGIGIITASDNKQALEEGRKKIITGLIGLVIVIAGIFLADLIGTIIGLDILNAGSSLQNLTP